MRRMALRRTTPFADDRFIFTVKTDNAGTSASNQFTIPTSTSGITQAFNYDIETSDGQTITGLTGDHTITFPTAGTYEVRISGSFPRMIGSFAITDIRKIVSINNFGIYGLGSTIQSSAFLGAVNMEILAEDIGHFENVTSFSLFLRDCFKVTRLPRINTSSATNFSRAFEKTKLTSFPLLDTSSVTNFSFAWANCSSLTSFPLLDTSSGTNFQAAWSGCSSLANYPANAFDTNIATNYTGAFLTTNLTTQSIDDILVSLDTSGVINGTFLQSGGQAPSATGLTARDNLVAKGWTITVTA